MPPLHAKLGLFSVKSRPHLVFAALECDISGFVDVTNYYSPYTISQNKSTWQVW